MSFQDAMAFAFVPPAVLELGNATGFDLPSCSTAATSATKALMAARNQFLGLAAKDPQLRAAHRAAERPGR